MTEGAIDRAAMREKACDRGSLSDQFAIRGVGAVYAPLVRLVIGETSPQMTSGSTAKVYIACGDGRDWIRV